MTETTSFTIGRWRRRMTRPVALLAVMALALAIGASAVLSTPPHARAQPATGIEGSWLVRLPDFGDEHQLASFLPGGVVLATNTPVEPDEEGDGRSYTTPGHGAWTSLGDDRYAFTFVSLAFDGDATFVSMITVDATVTLDATGERFSGSLTIRGMLPSGQEVFASPPFAIEATRIRPPVGG
ncbi:MAG: hypothetical protein ACRDJE_28660 [Dehalococcoidia bacterium]